MQYAMQIVQYPSARNASIHANSAAPNCKNCRGYRVIPKLSPKLSPRGALPCKICSAPLQIMQYPSARNASIHANSAAPPAKIAGGYRVIPKLSPKLSPRGALPCKICSAPLQEMHPSLQIVQCSMQNVHMGY